ncbi:MAG: hypothetical protein MR917_03095, partial [Treponema porcinum]|nr:hypothetical protein [Treponema porcinum]
LAPSVLHGKTDLCILPRFFHREKHWLSASFIFPTILIVRLAPSVLHGKTDLCILPLFFHREKHWLGASFIFFQQSLFFGLRFQFCTAKPAYKYSL